MKCPFCGREMTSGYVQSPRAIIFAESRHYISFWPSKAIGEFYVSSENWKAPYCVANHCPECKKVILDYTAG